ncbi:MAG: PDZ domain-containing protein [Pirellulales bacterium]
MKTILATAALAATTALGTASFATLSFAQDAGASTPPEPLPPAAIQPEAPQSDGQQPEVTDRQPGYFGVIGDDRTEAGSAVRVLQVVPGGPAHRAGLRSGDRIVAVEGQPVRSVADMSQIVSAASPGETVNVEVDRGGAKVTLELNVGSRPVPEDRVFPQFGRLPESLQQLPAELFAPRQQRPLLGVRTVELEADARALLDVPVMQGAVVTEVVPGSPADQAGLRENQVIVALGDREVASPDDLAEAVEAAGAGATVKIAYYIGPERREQEITLQDAPNEERESWLPLMPRQPFESLPNSGVDAQRIDRLERRIEALERRLDELLERLPDSQ